MTDEQYEELRDKLIELVIRSEERVANINAMVGNLIKATESFNAQNASAQEIVNRLLDAVDTKERRLQRLEERWDDLDKKFYELLADYKALAAQKHQGDTNYNFKQSNQ